jgi:type IV pilus assembly protein PilM
VLRLYRKPNKGLIGVDISSTSVKLLELSVKNGRYWVESYALDALTRKVWLKKYLNPEAVGDALEASVNLPILNRQCGYCVPTSMVINKIIEMDADMTMMNVKFKFVWMLSNIFHSH